MKRVVPIFAGFLAAPIVPALAIPLFSPAFNDNAGGIVGVAAIFYFVALGPTIVLGVPLFLVLFRFDLVRWWSSSIGGSAIGMVVAFAVAGGATMSASALGFFAAVGALAALVFWLVAGRAAAELSPVADG